MDNPVGEPAKGEKAGPAHEPVTKGDIRATFVLACLFVITILMAVVLGKPTQDQGIRTFEDPGDPLNIVGYLAAILVFTFFLLWLAKKQIKWAIRLIILSAVGSAVFYVFIGPLLSTGMSEAMAFTLSAIPGVGAALLLWKHPEWYVIDVVGVLVSAGSASIIGISLEVPLVVALLAALAVYDAIAVYRTKHMLALADSVIELRLPILLVIPKHRGYKFADEANQLKTATQKNKAERGAMFMGLGDLVMPTILVISVLAFMTGLSTAKETITGFEVGPSTGDYFIEPMDVLIAPDHQSVTVQYAIQGPAPDPTAVWTLDANPDNDYEQSGIGLPATGSRTYAVGEPFGVRLLVNTTDGNSSLSEQGAAVHVATSAKHSIDMFLHNPPALGAAIGTLVGYGVLMIFVLKGNPQAGLPLLNGGAVVGFLVGLYSATGSLVFW